MKSVIYTFIIYNSNPVLINILKIYIGFQWNYNKGLKLSESPYRKSLFI